MASITGAPNALEMRLTELERLGLGRPANVLFSEYVAVLLAREVIDAATAERMSFAFHAAHYGGLNTEDPRFTQTIARLEAVVARIAAMSANARLELAQRVQRDLRTLSGNAVRSAMDKVPGALERTSGAPQIAAADMRWEPLLSKGFSDEGLIPSVPVHSADAPWKRRRRLQVMVLIPSAFALIFAGYASRDLIDSIFEPHRDAIDLPQPTKGNSPKDGWQNQLPKEEALRKWAVAEVGLNDNKAKLAYELLLAYHPKDALTLNNLAWLYLTTKDPAVHNPQRGLELAMRAISQGRVPSYLDTAAEAQFQTGNLDEAVKLEKEALQLSQRFSAFQRGDLESILNQQLEKFAAARKPRPRAASAPSAGATSSKPAAELPAGIPRKETPSQEMTSDSASRVHPGGTGSGDRSSSAGPSGK